MARRSLKDRYGEVCDEYLRRFMTYYGISNEDLYWVGDDKGGIAVVGDWYFGFDTIKYAVDNKLHDLHELLEWYDYCLVAQSVDGVTCPNFKHWHLGCPRLSAEALVKVRATLDDIERLKGELMELAEEARNRP